MSPRIIVGMAITLAASGGCNAIAGIEEPREPGSSGTSSGTVIDVARFVGNWSASGTASAENCTAPGFAYSENPQAYEFKVARASAGGGIVVENQSGDFRNASGNGACSVPLTVGDSAASIAMATTCTFNQEGVSGKASYTVATWNAVSDVLEVKAVLEFSAGARCDYRASFKMSRAGGGGGT
ncbi:MAG: hypothetical protein JST00_22840 [Deltaproteobacteria bacterium]|nr:hypothetical protein [Deltaproteobacteria bacterium]